MWILHVHVCEWIYSLKCTAAACRPDILISGFVNFKPLTTVISVSTLYYVYMHTIQYHVTVVMFLLCFSIVQM